MRPKSFIWAEVTQKTFGQHLCVSPILTILLNLESTELMLLMWCSPLRTYWRGHAWDYSNITAERHHQSLWLLNCSWVTLKFKGWIWHGVSLDSHSYKLKKTPKPCFPHRNIINKSVSGLPWLLSRWISWKWHTHTRKKSDRNLILCFIQIPLFFTKGARTPWGARFRDIFQKVWAIGDLAKLKIAGIVWACASVQPEHQLWRIEKWAGGAVHWTELRQF